jgi:hypothetical protein
MLRRVGKGTGSRAAPDDRLRVPTTSCSVVDAWWARCALPTLQEQFQGEKHARNTFIVRATVSDPAKRQAFDTWYSREHLPDAMKSFGAVKAWRYWSATDPSLHQAMYQLPDKAALDRATGRPEMKRLVDDFNRDWPDVTRTRHVLVLAEERGPA